MNVDLKITGRVESLHLEPGDRVIVTLDRPFKAGEAEAIQREVERAFPDHRTIILAADLRLTKETA